MSAPLLELSGVTRRFGAITALDAVDLQLGADELLVVLGPTGAGKTTLLRCIAGLEPLDAGRVSLSGREATHDPPAARDVALVFQNFSLYPDWTVRRNLEFPLRAPGRKLGRDERDARVAWAAELLHIGPLLERPAAQLSGGEMQRVAIGRALVRRPRLFLMDEPLTNLDAKLRESLRAELVRLRRELATPMVYVTHDRAEALSMGDRLLVLHAGRVLQQGTPEDVYERPVSPEVAHQLGQPAINVLEVRRVDGWWTTAGGQQLAPADAPSSARARLGLRPEHVQLTDGADAEVLRVEDMGPVRVVTLTWGHETLRATSPRRDVLPGARLGVAVDPGRCIVWGAGSGHSALKAAVPRT